MRIAVLAWGSLIWDPRTLSLSGDWQTDGPALPIEFARISQDGRITLIVVPGYQHLSITRWAVGGHDDLDTAVADLAAREGGTSPDNIHGVGPDGPVSDPDTSITGIVSAWLRDHPYLDAAIWTGLPPGDRWGEAGWGERQAVDHLASLSGDARDRAVEYVRKAPALVDTPIRRALERSIQPIR